MARSKISFSLENFNIARNVRNWRLFLEFHEVSGANFQNLWWFGRLSAPKCCDFDNEETPRFLFRAPKSRSDFYLRFSGDFCCKTCDFTLRFENKAFSPKLVFTVNGASAPPPPPTPGPWPPPPPFSWGAVGVLPQNPRGGALPGEGGGGGPGVCTGNLGGGEGAPRPRFRGPFSAKTP